MQICNDADLGTEYSFPQNQNITGKAPRLLPCKFNRFLPRPGVRSDNHVTDGGRKRIS